MKFLLLTSFLLLAVGCTGLALGLLIEHRLAEAAVTSIIGFVSAMFFSGIRVEDEH